jgi:methionine synthase II (cobalamin-independent)
MRCTAHRGWTFWSEWTFVDIAAFEVKYFFQWIERDSFKKKPKSMQLAAGIVDEGSYWIEPVKKIRERIADWARVVGEERLWASPSCGFGRHPSRGIPVLRAKMENMVEAAHTL